MKFIVGEIYTLLEILGRKKMLLKVLKIKFHKHTLRDMGRKFFIHWIQNTSIPSTSIEITDDKNKLMVKANSVQLNQILYSGLYAIKYQMKNKVPKSSSVP